jgi:hypothetical protein
VGPAEFPPGPQTLDPVQAKVEFRAETASAEQARETSWKRRPRIGFSGRPDRPRVPGGPPGASVSSSETGVMTVSPQSSGPDCSGLLDYGEGDHLLPAAGDLGGSQRARAGPLGLRPGWAEGVTEDWN